MSIRVGITMRVVSEKNYIEPRDAISHDWIDLFFENNIECVLIPNCGQNVIKFLEFNKLNAIILSNGNDLYDENSKGIQKNISEKRDLTEKIVFKWAQKNNVNCLGVCRGLQLINLIYGGKLDYKLNKNHNAKNHSVDICDPISQNYFNESTFIVNSYHNQGVHKKNLAEELIPFAVCDDETIEGFYDKNKNILAIQWHPERKLEGNYFNNQMPIDFLINGPWWFNKD